MLLGHAREGGGEVGTGGGDAHRHGHAAAHLLDHALHHAPALLVGEAMRLPRDAENGDAGDSSRKSRLHESRHTRRVQIPAVSKRRRHNMKNPRPINHQTPPTFTRLFRVEKSACCYARTWQATQWPGKISFST